MRVIFSIIALLSSVALLFAGNGLQGVLLPLRASQSEFGSVAIGFLGSSYFAGFVTGCLFGPRLVHAVGHIRAFAAMTAAAAVVALLHGFIVLPGPWIALRLLSGFAFAVIYVVVESWLNERATNEARGTVLGVYMVINLSFIVLGQLLLTVQTPGSFKAYAVASMLICLATIPVALTRARAPAPLQSPKIRFRHVWSISRIGVVGCIAVGAANGAFWSLAPVYVLDLGVQADGVALFMAATVLGGAISQWPLGWFSDRVDRRKILIAVAALASIFGGLLVWPAFGPGKGLLVLAALWGASALALYSLCIAMANDAASPGDFVEVSSTLLLAYGCGAVVGPAIAGGFIAAMNPSMLYVFTLLIHLLFCAFLALSLRRSPPAVEGNAVAFKDSFRAAGTVSPIFDAEVQSKLEDENLDNNPR